MRQKRLTYNCQLLDIITKSKYTRTLTHRTRGVTTVYHLLVWNTILFFISLGQQNKTTDPDFLRFLFRIESVLHFDNWLLWICRGVTTPRHTDKKKHCSYTEEFKRGKANAVEKFQRGQKTAKKLVLSLPALQQHPSQLNEDAYWSPLQIEY